MWYNRNQAFIKCKYYKEEKIMVISEVAKEIELTADTLRYYEKEGLIGPIAKGKSGIRNYTEEDLQRIKFVKCMREAGMEVKYLKRYIQLLDKGDETIWSV